MPSCSALRANARYFWLAWLSPANASLRFVLVLMVSPVVASEITSLSGLHIRNHDSRGTGCLTALGDTARRSVSRRANPGTDSQFPANCAGNLVSVPGLRRIAARLPQNRYGPRGTEQLSRNQADSLRRVGNPRAACQAAPQKSARHAEKFKIIRLRPGQVAASEVSLADETVDFVDGTSVAVGDDGHDFAPVAGSGGVFHELVVDALEELEILGVIDEEVIRLGDRIGQEFAFGIVVRGPGKRVGTHDEGQFATAEQAQAVHNAPILAEQAAGGSIFQVIGEAENGVGPVPPAAVAHDQDAILVGDQKSGDHQDRQDDGEARNTRGGQR